MHNYLSIIIWMPIFVGIIILLINCNKNSILIKKIAIISSALNLLIVIKMILLFDYEKKSMQFIENIKWIKVLNAYYYLGIDGISILLIMLTVTTTLIVTILCINSIKKNISQYLASISILSGLVIGIFSALDALLYYIFFEATLIPIYIIIGIWGAINRVYSAFKFFIYTLLGSLFMLIAILYLHNKTGTFDLIHWHNTKISMIPQIFIFLAFFFAFSIKVPIWPFHTWLPDAHVQAPTGGSVILASIMLKIGAYSFIRFSLPITPDASNFFSPVIIILSIISIIYISFIAIVQTNMKKLIAYSSIAHMGFVTLGLFLYSNIGIEGAIMQMISHGLISSAMFLCIGILYDRTNSLKIKDYSGIANSMPRLAKLALIFSVSNCSLPGTSGFIGEFMIILASLKTNIWISLIIAFSLILSAYYNLSMYKDIYLGLPGKNIKDLIDINKTEYFFLSLLAIIILFIGIYPKPFINLIYMSSNNLLEHILISKLQ